MLAGYLCIQSLPWDLDITGHGLLKGAWFFHLALLGVFHASLIDDFGLLFYLHASF